MLDFQETIDFEPESSPAPDLAPEPLRVLRPAHATTGLDFQPEPGAQLDFQPEPDLPGPKPTHTPADEPAEVAPTDRALELRQGIAAQQTTARAAQRREALLGAGEYAAHVADVAQHIHTLINLPWWAQQKIKQAAGVIPKDQPLTDMQPFVTPEQGQKILEYLNPIGPGDALVPDDVRRGLNEGGGRLLSGLSAPENIAALAVAAKNPEAVARLFQAQMAGQVPRSLANIAQAPDTQSAVANTVDAAANLAFLKLIDKSLAPRPARPTVLDFRPAGPAEAEPVKAPEAPSEFGGLPSIAPAPRAPESAIAPAPAKPSEPLSTIEAKYLAEDLRARKPLPADQVARAGVPLPEGYKLEGDSWTYHAPAPAETEPARMARENREAMAALDKAKARQPEERPAPAPEPEPESEIINQKSEIAPGAPGMPLGERPLDLLDWLESNFPQGVRTISKADYGEYVSDATGQARKMLSNTKGTRADAVLEELHNQGIGRRLENEDDLLHAISTAADARKGWAAQQSAAEAWADRTIAEGQKRLHAGLDPELLAAYAVKGAIHLARGLRDFTQWSGAMLSQFGESIRPHLQDIFDAAKALPTRQRAETIQDAPDISLPVKEGTAPDLAYTPRTFATITDEAKSIVAERGPEAAFELFKTPAPNLAPDTRIALGAELERHYRTQETIARAAGDQAAANAAADQQVALWKADAYGTDSAQTLNARKLYDQASPHAKLRQAQDMFDEAGKAEVDRLDPHIKTIADELRQGHQEALDQLRTDPETNSAARQAVDETVTNSPRTHQAVVMELAEPFASSPAILANARAVVSAKADELLNHAPRPAGLTAPQHLRAILDDLAARSATIASAHYQGAEPGLTLAQKYAQRLGLSEAAAARMAKSMDLQFEAMVKKAKDKLSQRIATQRAKLQGGLNADATDAAVDRAIRQQLSDLNTRLGELVARERATQEATQKTVGQRILDASGLRGDAATTLQEVIDRRFTALGDRAKHSRLKALDKSPVPLPRKLRSMSEDLLKLSRLGALGDDAYRDLVKRKLGLPTLTPEITRELVRRANDLERQPPGFLRDRAGVQLLNWVAKQAGVKWSDIPMGMFMSNILSGATTMAKIPLENGLRQMGENTIAMLRGRIGPVGAVQAFGRGGTRGLAQAMEILKTGIVTGVREGERPSGVMELQPFGRRLEYVNYYKWIGRAISALHVSLFQPAWELKQTMIARDLARTEGLRGQDAWRRATELLQNTPERIEAARAQAQRELRTIGNTSKLDLARRAQEILLQQREGAMPGSTSTARDYALRVTYLSKPYGVIGLAAETLRAGIEKAKVEFPASGRAVQSQLPFTHVVANLLNEKLNWTPVGAYRAYAGWRTGELYGRPIMDRGEVGDLLAKSILSTILIGAVGKIAGNYIHGSGPNSPSQRKQLQAAGWTPNSIGPVNGRYYSFLNSPAAAGLAWIGNWQDAERYGKQTAEDAEASAAFALKGMADVLIHQGPLEAFKNLLESFGNQNRAEGGADIERLLARTAGGFVSPNLLNQIDKIFDPTVYDSTGIMAALQSQVPFYRRNGQPVLNALGEPLERGPFDTWTAKATENPIWRTIADRHLWIPEIPKDVIVGDKKQGPGFFRTLNPDERYRYAKQVGQSLRASLSSAIYELLSMPPDQAQAYLHELVAKAHADNKPPMN